MKNKPYLHCVQKKKLIFKWLISKRSSCIPGMHCQNAAYSWPSQTNKSSFFPWITWLYISAKVMSLAIGLITLPLFSTCTSYPISRLSQPWTNMKPCQQSSSGTTKPSRWHAQKRAEILQIKQKGIGSVSYSTSVPSTPGPLCLRFIPPSQFCSVLQDQWLLAGFGHWETLAGRREKPAVSPLSFLLWTICSLLFCFCHHSGLTICFLLRFSASSISRETNFLN